MRRAPGLENRRGFILELSEPVSDKLTGPFCGCNRHRAEESGKSLSPILLSRSNNIRHHWPMILSEPAATKSRGVGASPFT